MCSENVHYFFRRLGTVYERCIVCLYPNQMILMHMRQKRGSRGWSVGFSGKVVHLNVRIKLRDKIPVMSGNSLMYPSKVDISQFPFGQHVFSSGFSKSRKSKYFPADVKNPRKVTNCGNFRATFSVPATRQKLADSPQPLSSHHLTSRSDVEFSIV
jgi:hypothetical protein